MSTKITTKEVATTAKSDLHVLVTQTEGGIPSLRRMPAANFMDAFGVNGLRYADNQLCLQCNGVDVGDPVTITGGGGGGGESGSIITITNRMASRIFTIMDSAANCNILFSVTSIDEETELPTGNVTASWFVNNTRIAIQTLAQGNNTYDVRSALVNGQVNSVRLTIEDSYGGTKSMTWTVTVASYSLTWNLGDIDNHGSDSLNVRLVPNGQGNKTVKVSVDGTVVYNQVVATSGRAVAVTIPAKTHGAHTILAWMEVVVDAQTISTTPLRHIGIWTVSGTTTPIIAVLNNAMTVAQYSTASIKFRVYDPQNETATITRGKQGTAGTSLSVGRADQTWAYQPLQVGTDTLFISCGGQAVTITLTVTSIGYDIQEVTRGRVMNMNPAGHSNSEANRTNFGYTDGNGVNHPFTWSSGFDWINGGFQQDSDGVTALVIKRGCYIECDRSIFNDDAKEAGKEFKIIFKVSECRDYDAEIGSCKANGIGLKLQAQQATLSSELQSATVQYCENKKIEMDINIEATSEDQLAVIWLEGVPSRGIAYADADNWQQSTPAMLRIGSDDCDVWLYRFKLYSTSLTRFEVLDNFTADCSNPAEMVARYERNDIFNVDGTINRTKLAQVAPELRIITISAERMTTSKSDNVLCNVNLSCGALGLGYGFQAVGATMKAQGTSSLEYALAALNLDIDFSAASSWQDGNGNNINAYSMTPNSIGVNYLNLKLNVASSENANNVCMADDYNAFQPWLSPARRANNKVRDTMEGHPAAIFFTNTSSASIQVGSRTLGAGETMLYGVGDILNSKKNFAVFGQDNTQWAEQCCVEISNNNNPQCLFKSADLSTETWDGNEQTSNFEFRYPKNPTAAMKTKFGQMLSWVVSTDTAQATGAALENPVEYGGTTYSADTAAYRAAKFKAELSNYFIVNSLLYHYLTTERHCMVDNRAKNCFVSYELDPDLNAYRWNFCKDYDNDTMAGNDNSGGLTFTYGMEDTDMVGAAYVFNAHDSVLWVNLKTQFADELKTMFLNREAAGAWSASRIIAKWKNYQSARPEALVVEDMWGKYFCPYINNGEERYIKMMLGTKEDQRQQFETYQEGYMSAKYGGSVSTADRISFRANAPESWQGVEPTGDIEDIVPYANTYITVKYGNAGIVRTRATRGQSYDIEMPAGVSLNDLEMYIYSASNIASVGSLAGLYTKFADLSSAAKLQEFPLGSGATGYSNTSLSSETGGVSFGNNILLEKIDLRGSPNLAQGLNLTALKALEEIYTNPSGVTGITFARNAPVRVAQLNALKQLTARDLTKIETFTMTATSLQTVWIENCTGIDTKTMMTNATALVRGRLLGVSWTLDNTALLLRLAGLAGLDDQGNNIDHFVLTGAVHVAVISTAVLATLTAAFPNLTITYDQILPDFTVTFKNGNTTIDTQPVPQGSAPTNPVTRAVNPIPTPTKASTAAKVYTFDGWSWTEGGSLIPDLSGVSIIANTTIYAHFTETTRTYTVKWYNVSTLLETQTVNYGACATYSGTWPKHPSDGDYSNYYLFKGWDKCSAFVESDLNIYAQYDVTTPPSGKTLSQMSPEELYSLIQTGVLSPTGENNNVISSGDTFDLVLGNDFTFTNVESYDLIPVSSPMTFDGTDDYFIPTIGEEGEEEEIKLFDTDKTFTLVCDFSYAAMASNAILMGCYDGGGFLLRSDGTNPNIRFGPTQASQVGASTGRDIVVLRHIKGESKLYVYASRTAIDTMPTTPVQAATITLSSLPVTEAPLSFGCQVASDGFKENYASGTVYWAKLWMGDLGEATCKKIAAWPRETYTMQAAGTTEHAFRNYHRADNDRCPNCLFLMKDLMAVTHKMNQTGTNSGGWKSSSFRAWLTNRILDAIPIKWQQLLLLMKVYSTNGGASTAITDPPAEDKLFIPCCKDVGFNTTGAGYTSESDGTFTIFTNDASRIKKLKNGAGAASYWWLRSPYTGNTGDFRYVQSSGSSDNYDAYYSYGVAFGFCI